MPHNYTRSVDSGLLAFASNCVSTFRVRSAVHDYVLGMYVCNERNVNYCKSQLVTIYGSLAMLECRLLDKSNARIYKSDTRAEQLMGVFADCHNRLTSSNVGSVLLWWQGRL